mmetsp:Transcript_18914/g.31289  ORF Transcript_18914/g.31289 Transcript_18914/m.31289 type:complete len:212 (+) Transcript_18914:228-863(+)|eukprot:CAMPEP_0119012760 /NCGR_PEP_ID=MMETSP1176-20130426/7494_1 /TAXON_ID=265551 /ORGANISM="Synedropsis recta cf, Strain CCMP1620" /LENGTH=211 /DNA_ID=CAMNT_0006965783 /DNA_START=224 /DNA_END=859 /DNA_ORIENTATION=+
MVDQTKRSILIATNAITCLVWLRVVLVYAFEGWGALSSSDACDETLRPALFVALAVSALVELGTSATGLTRSSLVQVLLFASVRTGTELWVTTLIGCGAWQHLFTALCWSSGEVVRFGCFAMDQISGDSSSNYSNLAKSVRYSVGPILFPLGAGGEMLMVIRAAYTNDRPLLYFAAALWPLGFYPLYKQLLKQRRKHFASKTKKEKVIKSI